MDEEEENIPTASLPAYSQERGIARTLSVKEWEQIEAVSASVRQVGRVMQAESDIIVKSLHMEREKGANKIPTEEEGSLPFCAETWEYLRSGGKNKKSETADGCGSAKAKKTKHSSSGRVALQASLESKARAELLNKVEAAKLSDAFSAPRIEIFGKRTEGFAAALEAWALSSAKRSLLDVVVSCSRAATFLREQCVDRSGFDAAAALEAAADVRTSRSGGVDALLLEAVTAPEALVSPSFAGKQPVSLYPEQREVAYALGRALLTERPLLLRYVTPPSGGKSSAAALFGATLAKVLEYQGTLRSGFGRAFVIYACFSNAVRVEVSRTVLAASVPFAVVTAGIASPSFSCYHNKETAKKAKLKELPPNTIEERVSYSIRLMRTCDRPPLVLVCDLESACAFRAREDGDHGNNDVLLIDELTVGSEPDSQAASVGRLYSRLLVRAARYTVLMSATVPEFSQLPELIKIFNNAHDHPLGAEYLTVTSRRLSIGVEARDAAGQLWLPHHAGEASVDALLADVTPDGHLLRFYGPEGIRVLLNELRLRPCDTLSVTDFSSHDTLRAAALKILREHQNELREREGLHVCDAPDCESAEGLATDRAWMHPGCTLVVANAGSENFYRQAMQRLFMKLPPISRLMTKQQKEKKERSRKPDSDEDERDKPVVTYQPKIRWPTDTVVNSREHFDKHGMRANLVASLEKRHHKAPPIVADDIVETSAVPLVESALSGVVLLDSPWSDRAFELCGLAMADSAQPSYVVSDARLVYGVNLPVNRVLCLLPFDSLGINEVRQLCGRAGRTGKGTKAEVVFRSPQLLRLALIPRPSCGNLERAPIDLLLESQRRR